MKRQGSAVVLWLTVSLLTGIWSNALGLRPLTFEEIGTQAVDLEAKCIFVCWMGRSDVLQVEGDKFKVTLYDQQNRPLLAFFPRAGLRHLKSAAGKFVSYKEPNPRHQRLLDQARRAAAWQFWLSSLKKRSRGYHIEEHYSRGVALRPYAFGIVRNQMVLDFEGRQVQRPVIHMLGITRIISDRGIVEWIW